MKFLVVAIPPSIYQQLTLMILWYFTIHKAQGKTLDCAVIDLVKSDKCCGTTLFFHRLYCDFRYVLLKPCSLELIKGKLVQFSTFNLIVYSKIKY